MHPLLKIFFGVVQTALFGVIFMAVTYTPWPPGLPMLPYVGIAAVALTGMVWAFFWTLFNFATLDEYVAYRYRTSHQVGWLLVRVITFILRVVAAIITLGVAFQGAKYIVHEVRKFGK